MSGCPKPLKNLKAKMKLTHLHMLTPQDIIIPRSIELIPKVD